MLVLVCMLPQAQSWFSTFGLLQVLSGGSSNSALKQSHKGIQLEAPSKQSQPVGAHVVAPCPHDGKCPMEGTKSWCHFAQRFQRSDLQRRHKVRACCNTPDHMSQDNRSMCLLIGQSSYTADHDLQSEADTAARI